MKARKSPLVAQLYNNTRIMTLLKWTDWYCIDKTGDGKKMQISCGTVLELFINSNTSFFFLVIFFCTRNPHVKTLDDVSVDMCVDT